MTAPRSISPCRPGKQPLIAFFTQIQMPQVGSLFESPVQSTKAWRAQDKSERAAGFTSSKDHVLLSFFTCDLCGIGIGPKHHERELYYLPVLDRREILGEDPNLPERLTQVTARALQVCGGCARHRLLPESFLLFPEQLWKLPSKEISEQAEAIGRFLTWMDLVLVTIWFAFHGVSVSPEAMPVLAPVRAPALAAARRTLSSLPLPSSKSAHPLSALMNVPTQRVGFMLA